MKGAPGWTRYGDVVDPLWKAELLRWLGQVTNLRVLVETGTCRGDTIWRLRDAFGTIYSIEASTRYLEEARHRFRHIPNVFILWGTSQKRLPDVFERVDPGPLLVYLDAHAAGNGTHNDDPLTQELRILLEHRPQSLIVIDDEDSADLVRCVNAGLDFSGWTREYRTGMVIMHRGGFTIPPFEGV